MDRLIKYLSLNVLIIFILAAAPGFADTLNVPDDYATIQGAVDAALPGYVITIAEGQWDGAVIDKSLTIEGAGDGTIITGGVHYGGSHPLLRTAFHLVTGSDGTEISHLKIENDVSTYYFFGIFSRYVDDVSVHHITIANSVQGISNYNGSGWDISHNTIYGTNPVNGGGIGILINAWDGTQDGDPDSTEANNNLIAYNKTEGIGDALNYSGPGICLSSGHGANHWPGGTLEGNIVYKNKCAHIGVWGVGIEVDDVRQELDANNQAITGNSVAFNDLRGSTYSLLWYNNSVNNSLSRNLGYDENRGQGSIGIIPPDIFE